MTGHGVGTIMGRVDDATCSCDTSTRPRLPWPAFLALASLYIVGVVGLTAGSPPPGRYDVVGNIALFVPFGLLGTVRWTRRADVGVLFAGAVVSASIELVQRFLLSGRQGAMQDVILNTSGTAVGCILGSAVLDAAAWARTERKRFTDGS